MKPLSELLDKGRYMGNTRKTRLTERGELMKFFKDRLNPERVARGLRPLSMSRMAYILQGIPVSDLYHLQKHCEKSKNFGAAFWYSLKSKKK